MQYKTCSKYVNCNLKTLRCGSLPWNPPTRCEHRYPIRNSTNLQVFVAMQQHSHSNAYAQKYRSVVAMIRLSKQRPTENDVF
jgi:hypothetical protein